MQAETILQNTISRDECIISTDRANLDLAMIHEFLSQRSYWCKGISFETVKQSINNSLCFGIYTGTKQVGFARVVTDYATFAYLADVFILEEFRGNGLSKQLVDTIMNHPDLQRFRRWILATLDAHELYRQHGWKELAHPERWMEVYDPEVYTKEKNQLNGTATLVQTFRLKSVIRKGVVGLQ